MLRFKAKALLKMAMATKVEQIYLVGDQGVYFMPKMEGPPPPKTIIYAEGCHPQKDEETWYDKKQIECGGDDFFHAFTTQEIRKIAATAEKWIVVIMDENYISIRVED